MIIIIAIIIGLLVLFLAGRFIYLKSKFKQHEEMQKTMQKIRTLDTSKKEILGNTTEGKSRNIEMTESIAVPIREAMGESIQYDPQQDFGIFRVGDPTRGGV
jgi:predicted Holliday junction resolvase-like endonuclease